MEFEIKDLVNHDIQLTEVDLLNISCESLGKGAIKAEEELSVEVGIKSEIIEENKGYSYLKVKLTSDVFKCEIVHRGSFEGNKEREYDKELFDRFLVGQGIRILWSYARETIFDLTSRTTGKPYMLPTLDVFKTLANANKKGDGNE